MTLRKILFILFLFTTVSCGRNGNHDETEIMFTVCIDGIKHLSVTNGLDCYYHAIEIDNKFVRCGE